MATPRERNSFSIQLEQLLLQANIKNATLAEALSYDISYISKWVTGSALPSRKNIERVLTAVSILVADQSDTEAKESLRISIGVQNDDALRDFIMDSLRDAYFDAIGDSSASQYLHNAALRVSPQGQGNTKPIRHLQPALRRQQALRHQQHHTHTSHQHQAENIQEDIA